MSKIDLFKSPLSNPKIVSIDKSTSMFSYNILGKWATSLHLQNVHCQRELCWTKEQYQAYVIHCLETKQAGSFILYHYWGKPNTRYLLDGQHRREAWLQFMAGKFPLEYKGETLFWEDFKEDQDDILHDILCHIDNIATRGDEYESELVEQIYNRFNFSGVAHERKKNKP